jgi:hypothetical protein
MIEKYSAGFLKLDSDSMERPTKRARLHGGRVVLLTGSTGTLGSYILADLLGRPEVSTVYLLNRFSAAPGTYSSMRQLKAFEERGLNTRLLTSSRKICYLEGDISQDRLGLTAHTYERVCSLSSDHVIADMTSEAQVFGDHDHSQCVACRFQFGSFFF